MIADPLWSCAMLLCGPLWVFCGSFVVLCGPLRSFAVFSHTLRHMALCLCLSVSGASRSSIETADESSWFSAWELPSTYSTLCFKEIRIPLEITSVFPSETLSQTPHFEILPRQVNRIVNKTRRRSRRSRRRSSLLTTPTYTTVDESWLFATSRSTCIHKMRCTDTNQVALKWMPETFVLFLLPALYGSE